MLGWFALVSHHGMWLGFYTIVELNSPLSILSFWCKIQLHFFVSVLARFFYSFEIYCLPFILAAFSAT
jgi:hypothetical protein